MTIGGIPIQPTPINAALSTMLLGALLASRATVRGTTLTAPLNWAILSATLILLASFFAGGTSLITGNLRVSAVWYAVGCSTFSPLMAVLGAKRPQNHGWQWVVFTLWLILIWPALQSLALPLGPRLELFGAWRLFLIVLVGLGLLNYLPTRHSPAATLVAAGQCVLLAEQLGFARESTWRISIGLGCFLIAAGTVLLRPKQVTGDNSLDQLSQRWLRFRNSFGAFWGLRIAQRVNETAKLRDWPVQLTWYGFESLARPQTRRPTAGELAEMEQTLDTLLRRFF